MSQRILMGLIIAFLIYSCKDEPTKPDRLGIQLTAEDASCIEAWLKISVSNITNPTVVLQRGDSAIATLQLTTSDTTIMDEGLLPGTTYTYTARVQSPLSPIWMDGNLSSQVQVRTMDTTSHDFNWEIFTLGDGTGSSCLYDVAIINDTLAYAVGEIYQGGTPYNVAKWNGREWELMRIQFLYFCNQTDTYPFPAKAI